MGDQVGVMKVQDQDQDLETNLLMEVLKAVEAAQGAEVLQLVVLQVELLQEVVILACQAVGLLQVAHHKMEEAMRIHLGEVTQQQQQLP